MSSWMIVYLVGAFLVMLAFAYDAGKEQDEITEDMIMGACFATFLWFLYVPIIIMRRLGEHHKREKEEKQ